MKKTGWFVYMIRCSNGSLYTGMTNDPARRAREHIEGRGCRYTRAFRGVELVYSERCSGKGAALRREACIKRLSRKEKLELAGIGKRRPVRREKKA